MSQPEARYSQRGSKLAESLVCDVSGLVSPPDVCLKLAEIIQSPNATAHAIGEIAIRDPNLTARLLKLVNSPFYGLRSKVDTVSRAVTVVGMRELYNLVLAVSAVRSFSNVPNQLVNMDTFWRHSIFCGLIARLVAQKASVLHPERLFIAGLLHDIGSLVLYSRLYELARDLLIVAGGDEEVMFRAEREELGFSHADLGSLLLAQWQVPETLQEAVRCHHSPAEAGSGAREAAIVHLGNVLANRSGMGGYCENTNPTSLFEESALEVLGLTEAALDPDAIIGQAGLQFTETARALAA